MQLTLFVLAVVAALASALSLLAKAESIRGSGRVCGGIAWTLIGAFLLRETYTVGSLPAVYGPLSAALAFSGLVTIASGVRKFLRRNVTA